MNEPSVFGGPEITMPKNNIHFDNEREVEHYELHNLYGFYYNMATYEALVARNQNQLRPFVLTRSFFAGT